MDKTVLLGKDGGFLERLNLAIGACNTCAFAMECGMSPAVLKQYLAGQSEPPRLVLIAFAYIAGVSLEWLITGEGPMEMKKETELMDLELYEELIEAVEEHLTTTQKALPPVKKEEAYRRLYELFKDMPEANRA